MLRTLSQSRQRSCTIPSLAAEQNSHTQPSEHFMWLKIPQTQENHSNHSRATFSRKAWEMLSSSVLVVAASVINIHCKHTIRLDNKESLALEHTPHFLCISLLTSSENNTEIANTIMLVWY